jgi:bifunctional DNA-binding transcriptional regulator/antitoxin component of YhaV-PrlF toxin-antitoxin module
MLKTSIVKEKFPMEKRRINISSKRQITIPSKYYEALGLSNEVDCIYANNMIILTPVRKEDPAFAEEILSDLIEQGYSGQKLLNEFKRVSHQIRPAVEKLIEEADALALKSSKNYIDRTDDIFRDNNETEA